MAKNKNDATYILDSKKGLPNKLLQADGTVTDIQGNTVVNPDSAWDSKPALPNKWLNPDGTYSTLNEIIASMVDTSIYVVVDELPSDGNIQKIYLVSDKKGGFVEYHWTGSKWDPIGMVEFNLSDYSTTKEMMNAIEASGVLTLNSAKAYTDEQIAGITVDPQVFYWDGKTDQTGIAFWQNVVEINKNNDVIVNGESMLNNSSTDKVFTIIKKGKLYNDLVSNGVSNLLFMYQIVREHTKSYSKLVDNISRIQLKDDNREGIITNIVHTSSAYQYDRGMYLDVNYNYSTPYTPQYPGSPATKKYVDDSIATNITNVLGGSY